jgi:hypothetical protein
MEESEISDLVQTLLSMSSSPNWCSRHGALLAFSSMSVHCPSQLCNSASFSSLIHLLKDALKDDKVLDQVAQLFKTINVCPWVTLVCVLIQFPVRGAATKTLGRLLCFQLQSEASTLQLVQLLVLALRDDSTEVRRRSLSCLKAAAKVHNWSFCISHC